jgi:hypothetical protein
MIIIILVVIAVFLIIYGLSSKDSEGFFAYLDRKSKEQKRGRVFVENEIREAEARADNLDNEFSNKFRVENATADANVAGAQATENEARLKSELIDRARELGLDLPTYMAILQKKEFNRLDLEKEITVMQEELRNALIAKHFSEHQMIGLLSTQLDTMYEQINRIQTDPELPDWVKQRMIEDREEYVNTLKEDRRVRQKRLLETDNGGAV